MRKSVEFSGYKNVDKSSNRNSNLQKKKSTSCIGKVVWQKRELYMWAWGVAILDMQSLAD